MRTLITLSLILIFCTSGTGQHIDLANGIFGNEWIDYTQSYLKIRVSKDDVYVLNRAQLIQAGIPPEEIIGRKIRVQHLGADVPVYVSTKDVFAEGDLIAFVGYKNRAELDRTIYENPDQQMLNIRYSLISDTAAYFLSWQNESTGNFFTDRPVDFDQVLPENRVYLHKEERNYDAFHYKPVENSDNVRYSSLVDGESFGTGLKNKITEKIDVIDRINIGRRPRLAFRYTTNRNVHNTVVKTNGETLLAFSNPAYRNHLTIIDTTLDYALISTALNVEFSTSGASTLHLAQLDFDYTRTIDGSKTMPVLIDILPDAEDKYFKIKNYSGPAVKAINTTTREVMDTKVENGNLVIFVPASQQNQTLALLDTPQGEPLIEKTSFINYAEMDHDFLIITSKRLHPNDGGSDPITDYANYRQSPLGGGFDPVIVDVEELYNQFAFGIDRHFLSIRHFAHFIHNKWSQPKFIFIIGKGREYNVVRKDFQLADPFNESYFVPTYGIPGSDNLLVSEVGAAPMIIPTGRFAARDRTDIANYLEKVMAHEANYTNPQTIEDRFWMKKVLHLSGGDKVIQDRIRNFLEQMEATIESSDMAADVTTFYKFSSDPVEIALSDELFDIVNEGLALITFFGHSAIGVLDFSLGDISSYDNFGKFPLVMALGCNSGNIHSPSEKGVSEEFVVTKGRGGIAFLASAGSAYDSQQFSYGNKFYEVLGSDLYGASIGEAVNAIIDTFRNQQSLAYTTFLQQLTLHGDPSIKLHYNPAPDFTPDGKTAKTTPRYVNTYEEAFKFCFDLVNLGQNFEDSITVRLMQELPSGEMAIDTTWKVLAPRVREEVCITLPITDRTAVGQHKIFVEVDSDHVVSELPNPEAELNNTLVSGGEEGFSFFMLNNTAKPVYPHQYGIIDNKRPTLIASTYNALTEETDFILQIDTTGSFDSPFLFETKKSNQRAAIQWALPFDLEHKKVYFWRISPDTLTGNAGLVWEASSFQYDKDVNKGWNQSHYHQLSENQFDKLNINPNSRQIEFAKNFQDLRIENRLFRDATDRPHFIINGDSKNVPFTPQVSPGIAVSLIDSFGRRLLTPFPETEYGTYNNRGIPIPSWLFQDLRKESTRQNLIRFLDEYVEDGTQVIINTIISQSEQDFQTQLWAADSLTHTYNLFNYLEKEGAQAIRLFEEKGGLPYIFTYIKGGDVLAEEIAETITDEVILIMQFAGRWFEGSVLTKEIGPSLEWSSVQWRETLNNSTLTDTSFLSIYGIRKNGTVDLLFSEIKDYFVDISSIDARDYPWLKLEFFTSDGTNLTPADLDEWRVIYEEVPDLLLLGGPDLLVYKDSLQQGDDFRLELPILNLSDQALNGIKATIELRNEKNETTVTNPIIGNFKANEVKTLSHRIPTRDLKEDYAVSIVVNPEKNPVEKNYYNNFASTSFHVFSEGENPILDVTFDGIHILNEDIVSPTPLIVIYTKDENPFLLLNDSSIYEIALSYPGGSVENIPVDDARMRFFPAQEGGAENTARLEFSPTFTEEGTYELTVRARDISGNQSGKHAYKIAFRVILKEMISEVYNYPNPFSTSTEFIFTLTGSTLPQDFAIQILTISGKVVREISAQEFGPLRIGLNRSNFRWDGRDEYGEKLASGVYLYRMLTRKADGNEYEKLSVSENEGQHFKKGWGKMVIMR